MTNQEVRDKMLSVTPLKTGVLLEKMEIKWEGSVLFTESESKNCITAIVKKVGPNVDMVKVGDKVLISGKFYKTGECPLTLLFVDQDDIDMILCN